MGGCQIDQIDQIDEYCGLLASRACPAALASAGLVDSMDLMVLGSSGLLWDRKTESGGITGW